MGTAYSPDKGQILEEVLAEICQYLRDQEVSGIDEYLNDKLKRLEEHRLAPIKKSDTPSESEDLVKRLLRS